MGVWRDGGIVGDWGLEGKIVDLYEDGVEWWCGVVWCGDMWYGEGKGCNGRGRKRRGVEEREDKELGVKDRCAKLVHSSEVEGRQWRCVRTKDRKAHSNASSLDGLRNPTSVIVCRFWFFDFKCW